MPPCRANVGVRSRSKCLILIYRKGVPIMRRTPRLSANSRPRQRPIAQQQPPPGTRYCPPCRKPQPLDHHHCWDCKRSFTSTRAFSRCNCCYVGRKHRRKPCDDVTRQRRHHHCRACGVVIAAAYNHCKNHSPFSPVEIFDFVYKTLDASVKVGDVFYHPLDRDSWKGERPF